MGEQNARGSRTCLTKPTASSRSRFGVFPIWDSVTGTLRTRAGQHAEERRQAIAQAADKARHTRDLLARHGIACPTITGAGTSTFEFETASGVYTELHCGSYIFMDADYGRNRDRDGGPFTTFEPSLLSGRR